MKKSILLLFAGLFVFGLFFASGQTVPPIEQAEITIVDDTIPTDPVEEQNIPIALWIGAISGILLGALKIFGLIASLTKTSKDDEIYQKINEKLEKLPDIFGVANGQLVKKK